MIDFGLKTKHNMFTWVFQSNFLRLVVLLLLFSFLLQPISLAYASEGEDTLIEIVPAPAPEVVSEEIEADAPADSELDSFEEGDEEVLIESDTNESDVGEIEQVNEDNIIPDDNETPPDAEFLDENTELASSSSEINENTEFTTSSSSEIEEIELEMSTSTNQLSDFASNTTTINTDYATSVLKISEETENEDDYGSSSHTDDENMFENNASSSVSSTSDPFASLGTLSTTSNSSTAPDERVIIADDQDEVEEVLKVLSTTTVVLGVASSSQLVNQPSSTSVIHVNDAYFQFDKNSCVSVGEGSFYCGQADQPVAVENEFYAAKDEDGDLEIFVTIDGQTSQITDNDVDDQAPYYDGKSDTIVWHRLVNDRYQIMAYDFDTKEEDQLTNDGVNNMQPSRFGDITVWQRWVRDNWEIILLKDGEEIQISNNNFHDISPKIRGDYVMWSSPSSDVGQTLNVYDIKTGQLATIDDSDGGAAQNPRMVLVYDKQYENGDVVTRGYDLATGKIVPLSALPGDLPEEVPESDQTGETRALIQQKSSVSREDAAEEDSDQPKTLSPNKPPIKNASTTKSVISDIDAETLFIPAATSSDSSLVGSTSPEYVLDEVMPTIEEKVSTSTTHIPDLIIPPATSTDSNPQL